mmetsp:Transcript_23549/g.41749  ORF Transcript_23549/g.41749 Transcript_23549/m.41749 type:complete len:174 (-) Transcript_23549:58-579(-)|eukprot:CAMPEP_0204906880 /NCGR_PEP_ID=MMETSP1397-20131031/6201_1 /ASSEMBLY_ACC=CAM_ASM_000891 /TAXON_ID=49980 /ORGANISM="Climacostomum Climacostomum virens, Strain Stock W-24" /LENGTH=173 /DNA_ID=CAMNT_0052075885 /DNA_START=689 /DNA_END=1210 /DNA_ORIENTATION=-
MFFLLSLKKNLLVTPDMLGPKLFKHLKKVLKRSVEGTCSSRYGYIINVLIVDGYGEGKIKDGNGDVLFPVSYKALVFMPYQGEILDAEVTQVIEIGFMANVGPLKLFVSSKNIIDYHYDPNARPTPKWVNREDSTQVIEPGRSVRVKVTGVRVESNDIFAVCTIADDYLGPIG